MRLTALESLLVTALLCSLSACTGRSEGFSTFRYVGIDLLAGISGTVYSGSKECLYYNLDNGHPVTLILPEGTKWLSEDELVLPERNGAGHIKLGQPITLQGGFVDLGGGFEGRVSPDCVKEGFMASRVIER
jgi:hypothetical protein